MGCENLVYGLNACEEAGLRIEVREGERADGDCKVLECHRTRNEVGGVEGVCDLMEVGLIEPEYCCEAHALDVRPGPAFRNGVHPANEIGWDDGVKSDFKNSESQPDQEDLFEEEAQEECDKRERLGVEELRELHTWSEHKNSGLIDDCVLPHFLSQLARKAQKARWWRRHHEVAYGV